MSYLATFGIAPGNFTFEDQTIAHLEKKRPLSAESDRRVVGGGGTGKMKTRRNEYMLK